MASPTPVTAEKKEETASEPSPTVIKEEEDTDFEGTNSKDVIENSKKHEDEKKELDTTEADSTETVSEKIEKDNPDNKDPAESSDKEEDKDVTNEVKDTVTVGDEEEKVKDKEPKEDKSVESKLDAEALSASLSSSRCLLKRNRDDLDVDSDGDNQEEPDCKKSHTAAAVKTAKKEEQSEDEGAAEEKDTGAPVVVEKSLLPLAELVASLSSSKSVLKRSIDQVTESAEGSAAPEVKKSNIVSKKTDDEKPCKDEVNTTEPSGDLKTPVKPSRTASNVSAINIPSPRMLIMSPPSPLPASRCPLPVLESTRLSPLKDGELPKEDAGREDAKKSPKIPKDEVRIIAAKDLAEDRKLEKRRLNKLLTIFDDQKPVK